MIIQTAIAERRQTAPEVATRIDRQSFWTKQMLTVTNTMRGRLKASELLGKSQSDIIEVRVALIVTDPHESVIGVYKTEVSRRKGPWRTLEAVEFATLTWVDWFNTRRLLGPLGDIPPAEFEAQYYAQAAVA